MNDELKSPGVQRLRAVLDESAAHFDGATLSRLNRGRQAALTASTSRRRYVVPIGLALAASLMLALLLVRMQPDSAPLPVVRQDQPKSAVLPAPDPAQKDVPERAPEIAITPVQKSPVAQGDVQAVALEAADIPDDLADLPGDDADELAQEDLEFYAWLDAQEAQDG